MSLAKQQADLAVSVEAIEREAKLRFGPGTDCVHESSFPIDEIVAPNEDNHRFAAGQTIGGITLSGDLRNIAGMKMDIKIARGIQNPLVGVRRRDGRVYLKQGFRRYNAAMEIRREEPTSSLAGNLAGLPMLIYSGLSPEQERTLVNDQTSKPFSCAEVWNIFREEIRSGRNWLQVMGRMYQQIGLVTGSLDKVRKIDGITDPAEREKELRQWGLSFVYQGWYNGLQCGKRVEDYWLQTYLWSDKYPGVRRPAVVMNTTRQKELSKAMGDDQAKGQWTAATQSGVNFDALLTKYIDDDNKKWNEDGTRNKKDGSEEEKIVPLKDLQALIKQEEPIGKPTLLSRIYRICLKGGGDVEATKLVRTFDKLRAVFNEHREYVNDELRETLALIFDGNEGSDDKLLRICMANAPVSADTTPVTPVVETPVTPVVETPVVAEIPVTPVSADTTPVTPVETPVNLVPTESAGDTFSLTNETAEHPGDSTVNRDSETGKTKKGGHKKHKQNS